jgi:general secretion pathway protein B
MSYILDALKRADADRERGHVPGLHSQTAGLATAGPSGRPLDTGFAIWQRPARLAALALAALAAAGAASWWWSRQIPEPVPAADPLVLNAPTATPTSAAPAPPAPVATATPLAAPVLPILAPPAAPPATAATAPNARPPIRAGAGTGTPTAASATPLVDPASPLPATAGTSVRRFADLPPETRAQMPTVSVSGSTYSQNPAHRMLIANGKVVHEGGEVAPGLTLETIGPRSAVLNHQGVRYSIGY